MHTQATTLRNSNQDTHNVELHVLHIDPFQITKKKKSDMRNPTAHVWD